ncbi:MAG: hypothetical protein R3C05_15005 [Pirellulaceae bacterium]
MTRCQQCVGMQEFDDRVLMQHVDLYVNQWTFDLGSTGKNALDELSRAAAIGLGGGHESPLRIFPGRDGFLRLTESGLQWLQLRSSWTQTTASRSL